MAIFQGGDVQLVKSGDRLYFGKPVNISRLDKVKNVIRNEYSYAMHGLFFTPNWVGDPMSTIWEEDGVTIDICYNYEYFEVFGLTEEEENELLEFYSSLRLESR